jgi:polar amino acid transport system substrate-binding protein
VYDTNDLAIEALGQGTIDGVIVDLPTADYITNVQVEDATIVGQFEGGTPEHFSAVLAKDSPLTDCVNTAIAALTADGTLDALASQFLPFQDTVPVIKP